MEDKRTDTAVTDEHGPDATPTGASPAAPTDELAGASPAAAVHSRLIDEKERSFARLFLQIGPKPDIVEAVALWSLAGGFVTAFAEENRELVRDVDQFGKACLVLYPDSPMIQALKVAAAIAGELAALLTEDEVTAMTQVLRP